MKKIFLILAILSSCLLSGNIADIKAQIISNIAKLIIKNKKVIKVYMDDPKFLHIFSNANNIQSVENCKDADIIITNNTKNIKDICKDKDVNVISTSYQDYKNYRDFVTGAFFWQKGRPNILLNSIILQKRSIEVPKSYKKYLD